LHVQKHHLGPQATGLGHRRGAVDRLADDVEALCLQQDPGGRPERGMVIDDEHGVRHFRVILSAPLQAGYTVGRT
jgi:hypothetical protein